MGFFGGREIVKGYFFLKDCLEKYKRKDEFEIILIDTSKRNGFEGCIKDDVWPVESRIIGYVKHDKMCDIYKKVDVLIIAGDVYDKNVAPEAGIRVLRKFLGRLVEAKIKVMIIFVRLFSLGHMSWMGQDICLW